MALKAENFDANGNPILESLQDEIYKRAAQQGIPESAVKRQILAEVQKDDDVDALREQVRKVQSNSRAKQTSFVPEGREADFPHLVFHEQL